MKRTAEELSTIAKRYKKLNPREHVVQRPDMYVGPTRPKRMEGHLPDLKTFKFTNQVYHFPPALGKIADEVIVNSYDNINRPSTRKFLTVLTCQSYITGIPRYSIDSSFQNRKW